MKKFMILGLLSSTILLAGCTKKYDSVENYAEAMKAVQQSHKSIKMEVQSLSWMADSYAKSFFKDNKWRADQSMNGGRTYFRTVLYDGTDIVSYTNNTKFATLISTPKNEEELNLMTSVNNIAAKLLDWNNPTCLCSAQNIKPEFVNEKDNKNGFPCRLIKYGNDYEACISDKLGFAVYVKSRFAGLEDKETVYNLVSVETDTVQDAEVLLPEGLKKITLENMLKEFSKGNFSCLTD